VENHDRQYNGHLRAVSPWIKKIENCHSVPWFAYYYHNYFLSMLNVSINVIKHLSAIVMNESDDYIKVCKLCDTLMP